MPRISTGTGDDGTTGLFGGERVDKTHPRIAAYGAVDELNGHLGVALAELDGGDVADAVEKLQHKLFHVGADLATPPDRDQDRRITEADVEAITARIEALEDELPPLDAFVLPGGSRPGAQLHLARTVCRRAEREAWALPDAGEAVRVYLNRLSDYLFLLARKANRAADAEEPRVRYEDPGETS